MEVASENKRGRGRPTVAERLGLKSEVYEIFRGIYPGIKTRRGLTNKIYEVRAHSILHHDGEFKWIVDVEKDVYKAGILGELGRVLAEVGDEEIIKTLARTICKERPRVKDAIEGLRAWRELIASRPHD